MRYFFILLLLPVALHAQEPPSYTKQIQPFFNRYCVECHPAREPDGELSLDTYKGLLAGGSHGKAIEPGQPDASTLLRMVEGRTKPAMPPKKAKQPKAEEVALLRAWIAAGAKNDGADAGVAVPDIKPKQRLATPVAALAYTPDGKILAAAGAKEVLLFASEKGD